MKKLEKTGLKNKIVSETVLTTISKHSTPHNAVIGVKKKGKDEIELKIYEDSKTHKNISKFKEGTVNILDDVKSLLKLGLSDFLSEDISPEFLESEKVKCPYLNNSEASIEFVVDNSEEKTVEDEIGKSQLSRITGKVKKIHISEKIEPHPPKRIELYLIEAAIIGTRIREAEKKGKTEIAKEYLEELEYFQNKCKSIAPESEELRLISKIKENSLST